jgi:hypothetical protein
VPETGKIFFLSFFLLFSPLVVHWGPSVISVGAEQEGRTPSWCSSPLISTPACVRGKGEGPCPARLPKCLHRGQVDRGS